MRRVYYSYALDIAGQTVFWQGIFLGAAAILLAHWLHVASIINNFLSVPVGQAPQFVVSSFAGAVSHGEMLTVVTLLLASAMTVSVGYKLTQAVVSRSWMLVRI